MARTTRRRAFSRDNNTRARSGKKDEQGIIRVSISLIEPQRSLSRKGNITRSFRIAQGRVSSVDDFLQQACFGDMEETTDE